MPKGTGRPRNMYSYGVLNIMKQIYKNILSRLILLVLILSVVFGSLVSCGLFTHVADKSELQANIDNSAEETQNEFVFEYLRDWGMPLFNQIKFRYFEKRFKDYFNMEEGLPNVYTHAKETADLFLAEFYDNTDLSDSTAVTDALLDCYVTAIGDPYSAYRPPVETEDYLTDMSGKFGGIGVMVEYNNSEKTIMVSTVYPDSPAEKAGIKVGDYLYAVDGKTVEELGYNNAVNYVRGEIGTSVTLEMIRDGEHVICTAVRAEVEELNVVYDIDTESNVGYVQIVGFKGNTFDQFKNAIDALEEAGVDGIVFDLRGNPGGYVDSVVAVISYLIPDGKTVMSYQYKGQDRVELISDDGDTDHVVDLPFVVICNQYTASAGEIFTAAIRDYRNEGLLRAAIVGTTTYKKGIMQSSFYYPADKSTVTMTVAYYNPPCGKNYHGIGVEPDVYVEDTSSEVDLQLSSAFDEIKKLINDN